MLNRHDAWCVLSVKDKTLHDLNRELVNIREVKNRIYGKREIREKTSTWMRIVQNNSDLWCQCKTTQ